MATIFAFLAMGRAGMPNMVKCDDDLCLMTLSGGVLILPPNQVCKAVKLVNQFSSCPVSPTMMWSMVLSHFHALRTSFGRTAGISAGLPIRGTQRK